MTAWGWGFEVIGPQEVMVWAVPSLCGLLLACACPAPWRELMHCSKCLVASPNARDFAERALRNVWPRSRQSLRFDVSELHHLGPFLNVFGDELAEFDGRTCKRRIAKVCNPRFHRGIGKNGIDLLIEFLDDIGRCIHWRADTQPRARVVARQKIAQRWDIRQRRRARCRCHCQRAQLAGSDKLDRRSKGIEYNLYPAAN